MPGRAAGVRRDTTIIGGGTVVAPILTDTTIDNATLDIVGNGTVVFSNDTTNAGSSGIGPLSIIDATGTATMLSLLGPFTSSSTIEATGSQASLAITLGDGSAAPGSFSNQGTILVTRGDSLSIGGGTFATPGAVLVEGGIATIAGTLSNLGNYAVDTGGTLDLNQTGGNALTEITFTGTSGEVKLDNPAAFAGGINNFALGDTLDLGPVNISTVVFDDQGDLIAIGSGGTVFEANWGGHEQPGTLHQADQLSGRGPADHGRHRRRHGDHRGRAVHLVMEERQIRHSHNGGGLAPGRRPRQRLQLSAVRRYRHQHWRHDRVLPAGATFSGNTLKVRRHGRRHRRNSRQRRHVGEPWQPDGRQQHPDHQRARRHRRREQSACRRGHVHQRGGHRCRRARRQQLHHRHFRHHDQRHVQPGAFINESQIEVDPAIP